MALEINVVKQPENQQVLISEKTNKKGQSQERLFIVPEEKADKFINSRKNEKISNSLQKTLSYMLVPAVGILAAVSINTSKLGRIAAGCIASGLTFQACKNVDNAVDKYLENTDLKRNKAIEVTGQDINQIA